MSEHSYQEIRHTSYFTRIKNALFGFVFGFILFLGAIPFLFWNEGRAVKTYLSLKEGASSVIETSHEQINPQNNGKLVHLSGKATTDDSVSDNEFSISVQAIALKREVEMLQWEERKTSKKQKKLGGGTETITTYKYSKKWSTHLINSSRFKKRSMHKNPKTMPINSSSFQARKVNIGEFILSRNLVNKINNYSNYNFEDISSAPQINGLSPVVSAGVLYYGADQNRPQIGDIRVKFKIVNPQMVSLIAKQDGKNLRPFMTSVGESIELLEVGQHSAKEMFDAGQASNTVLTWIIRVGGFFMMFIGMSLMLGPLSVLADVVPLIGSIVGIGTSIISFCIAAPLSLTVIAVAWITYRPMLGLSLIGTGAFLFFYVLSRKKKLTSHSGVKSSISTTKKRMNTATPGVKRKQSTAGIRKNVHQKEQMNAINLDDEMNKYSQVSKSSTPENDEMDKNVKIHLESKYYIYGKGKKYGPFSIKKIERYLDEGKIKLSTPCKEVDGSDKIRINDIPGLKKSA